MNTSQSMDMPVIEVADIAMIAARALDASQIVSSDVLAGMRARGCTMRELIEFVVCAAGINGVTRPSIFAALIPFEDIGDSVGDELGETRFTEISVFCPWFARALVFDDYGVELNASETLDDYRIECNVSDVDIWFANAYNPWRLARLTEAATCR